MDVTADLPLAISAFNTSVATAVLEYNDIEPFLDGTVAEDWLKYTLPF